MNSLLDFLEFQFDDPEDIDDILLNLIDITDDEDIRFNADDYGFHYSESEVEAYFNN